MIRDVMAMPDLELATALARGSIAFRGVLLASTHTLPEAEEEMA